LNAARGTYVLYFGISWAAFPRSILQLRGIEEAYLAQTCRSGLRREERKIGPEQDLCRRHQFGERRQRVDGHGIGRKTPSILRVSSPYSI